MICPKEIEDARPVWTIPIRCSTIRTLLRVADIFQLFIVLFIAIVSFYIFVVDVAIPNAPVAYCNMKKHVPKIKCIVDKMEDAP